jgi:hypothetical protein
MENQFSYLRPIRFNDYFFPNYSVFFYLNKLHLVCTKELRKEESSFIVKNEVLSGLIKPSLIVNYMFLKKIIENTLTN